MSSNIETRIAIVGGCGHVGLPLGLAFAAVPGIEVTLIDKNEESIRKVRAGQMPFREDGGAEALAKVAGRSLRVENHPSEVAKADFVVFVTGTPVDEHLNPCVLDILSVMGEYLPHLHSTQMVILRSTIFPGVTRLVAKHLEANGCGAQLAFCPERVSQGNGLKEIASLPQIVSAFDLESEERAVSLFEKICQQTIRVSPEEAELAKLFANSWRYIEFAIANQHYMIAEHHGVSFQRVYQALTFDYPRARHFTRSGLTAGPCLLKDTLQLSSAYNHNFFLGHSAMLINEGMPSFLVNQLEKEMGDLSGKRIGLLGMAFKPNSDDTRDSLSYKVRRILKTKMAIVLDTDVYQDTAGLLPEILQTADGFVLGVPHDEYRSLKLQGKPFVDCWGVWDRPSSIQETRFLKPNLRTVA